LIAILIVAPRHGCLIGFSRGLDSWRGGEANTPVRWKVKAGSLLNRNRKILPAALYQGHFTSRLKKALASRGPVTPLRTVIKRTPFISQPLRPSSPSLRPLSSPFLLSLSLSLSLSAPFLSSLLRCRSQSLPSAFERTVAKSISMSTFVLFSEGPRAPMGLLCA